MTPEQLSAALGACLADIRQSGDFSVEVPQNIQIRRSRRLAAGGWTTNIALQLAKSAMMPAIELAGLLASRLDKFPGVRSVQVSGPGFIDISVDFSVAAAIIQTIVQAGPKFGFSSTYTGHVIQLNFYPEGAERPLKIESVRQVLLGDFLRRIFQAMGAEVSYKFSTAKTEFQLDECHKKFLSIAIGSQKKADWPAGKEVIAVARQEKVFISKTRTENNAPFYEYSYIQQLFADLGVIVDFSAKREFGNADRPSANEIQLAGGPRHFSSVELVEAQKDSQHLSRQALDTATTKHVPDAGFPDWPRAGAELLRLLDGVGPDALRFAVARCPLDSALHINSAQLRVRNFSNPIFTVQFALARTRNVARWAAADGISAAAAFAPELLTFESESELLATLSEFPTVVAQSVELLEPHRIARYLEGLAGAYHQWYDQCPVRPQSMNDPVTELHHTRLWLNNATGVVLANGLDVLGVTAPERM